MVNKAAVEMQASAGSNFYRDRLCVVRTADTEVFMMTCSWILPYLRLPASEPEACRGQAR